MGKLVIVTIVSLVYSIFCTSCAASSSPNRIEPAGGLENSPTPTPTIPAIPTLSSVQLPEKVLEYVRIRLGDSAQGAEMDARQIELSSDSKLLSRKLVFSVTVYNALPPREYQVVADPTGVCWLMPDEFNAMILTQQLQIANETQAMDVVKAYLSLYQPGKNLLLEKASDIPYTQKVWTDPQQYDSIIRPADARSVPDGIRLTFFSWSEIAGVIYQWDCVVNPIGEITVLQKTLVAQQVGDAVIKQ